MEKATKKSNKKPKHAELVATVHTAGDGHRNKAAAATVKAGFLAGLVFASMLALLARKTKMQHGYTLIGNHPDRDPDAARDGTSTDSNPGGRWTATSKLLYSRESVNGCSNGTVDSRVERPMLADRSRDVGGSGIQIQTANVANANANTNANVRSGASSSRPLSFVFFYGQEQQV